MFNNFPKLPMKIFSVTYEAKLYLEEDDIAAELEEIRGDKPECTEEDAVYSLAFNAFQDTPKVQMKDVSIPVLLS